MKLKILTLILALAAYCSHTFATENYLHIQTDNGWTIINIDNVDRISFSDGKMVITDKEQTTTTIAQTELVQMLVNESASIESVEFDNNAAKFTIDAQTKTVKMTTDGNFRILSVNGKILINIPTVKSGETISLDNLNAGVYILQSSNYAIKIVTK